MAIGTTENMASALNAVRQTRSVLSIRQKLLLLLLAEEATGGGTVASLSRLAQFCGTDDGVAIYDDLVALATRGYLSISARHDDQCFCALGIATKIEAARAARYSDCTWPIEKGPAVDSKEAQSLYVQDRWNRSGAGDMLQKVG